MNAGSLYKLAAFTTTPDGGNPAGVWIGDALPDAAEMQHIAKRVGFSETAFVAVHDNNRCTVRYYSPEAEVAFCGHATIASGVQLAELYGPGVYTFDTAAGEVVVSVKADGGMFEASLTSVAPRHIPAPEHLLEHVLSILNWHADELDPDIPPALIFGGIWHFLLAAKSAERLARLDYDFDALKKVMLDADLTTIQLIWRESPDVYHARDPFPVGGVVEDPATGAAAAALGGYLRDTHLVQAPALLLIRQGETMGRPSRLRVAIPATGGIVVSGHAVKLI
jgi:PhzF family phenazine biosynthesis protein